MGDAAAGGGRWALRPPAGGWGDGEGACGGWPPAGSQPGRAAWGTGLREGAFRPYAGEMFLFSACSRPLFPLKNPVYIRVTAIHYLFLSLAPAGDPRCLRVTALQRGGGSGAALPGDSSLAPPVPSIAPFSLCSASPGGGDAARHGTPGAPRLGKAPGGGGGDGVWGVWGVCVCVCAGGPSSHPGTESASSPPGAPGIAPRRGRGGLCRAAGGPGAGTELRRDGRGLGGALPRLSLLLLPGSCSLPLPPFSPSAVRTPALQGIFSRRR